ncbi:MAG: hypothetical protein ACOCWL_03330 [Thermoguttaceae bacterium]
MPSHRSDQPVNPKLQRKQLFVDPKVQGALVFRAVLYWTVCLVTMFLMLLCWRIVTGPARPIPAHFDDMWFFYGPAAVASFVLLPLVIVDVVRISNRFAGPLLRLRRSMRALARGEHVEPIEFRDGDFWQDFAEEFNQLVARVQGPDSTPNNEAPAADECEELVLTAGS